MHKLGLGQYYIIQGCSCYSTKNIVTNIFSLVAEKNILRVFTVTV